MAIAQVRTGLMYAWRGPSLLITGPNGQTDSQESLHGFFFRETRVLRTICLTVNGESPWLCETAALTPDSLSFSFIYPEISSPGGGGTGQSDDEEHLHSGGVPERALDMRLVYRLRVDSLEATLSIINRARRGVRATVKCALDADFADILEAQSGKREQHATVDRRQTGG